MDYISQSPIQCSKGNIKCVLKCTILPEKKDNGYMPKMNLVLVLTNKGEEKINIPNF